MESNTQHTKIKNILERYVDILTSDTSNLRNVLISYVNKIYSEKHRYYHTLEHVYGVYNRLINNNHDLFSLMFAITHDLVYNPRSNNNEECSVDMIKRDLIGVINDSVLDELCLRVLDTKNIDSLSIYNIADRYDVLSSVDHMEKKYFPKIVKEFQCFYYKDFIKEHCRIIMKIREAAGKDKESSLEYANFVRNYKPTVAVYVGSFNPVHVGHYHILTEAEKVFDHVIIAKGNNPDKTDSDMDGSITAWNDIPSTLWCKDTIKYNCTVFDLHKELLKKYDKVTFIKGFRNGHDIEYDLNQYNVIRDIDHTINFMFIPCNQNTGHISSSMIRNLEKLNLPTEKYLLK